MLRIDLLPEPADFDVYVRQFGLAWLRAQPWDMNCEAPEKTVFPDFWKHCRDDLRSAYGARCCFTGTYMRKSEVIPVEHFLAKIMRPDRAYEWDNYRYCCSRINSRKGKKFVLDPTVLPIGVEVFHLNFVTGSILPNSALKAVMPSLYHFAEFTISKDGLDLDDSLYRDERMEFWNDYLKSSKNPAEQAQLKKGNIFVWSEAVRLRLL